MLKQNKPGDPPVYRTRVSVSPYRALLTPILERAFTFVGSSLGGMGVAADDVSLITAACVALSGILLDAMIARFKRAK